MNTSLNTIPFKQVREQYNDSNSIVCMNLLAHQEELADIDNYLSEQGLFNKGFPMSGTYVLCEDCWSEFLEWIMNPEMGF